MTELATYDGSCHCGAVRFRFQAPPITRACRCNCSICRRKPSLMSTEYIPRDRFELLSGADALETYRWGDRMVNFSFCRHCGVHPFHDATTNPGHYRVNLGCVDAIDAQALPLDLIDGKSF